MRSADAAALGLGATEVAMARNRRPVAVAAASLLAFLSLLSAGTAYAATPQKIYRDLADNGQLDGHYTRAEIERAFDLPPSVGTDEHPREPIRVPQANEAAPAPQATGKTDRRVPFSALDAALLAAVGGPLLLIGAGLRRRLSEPSKAQVVGG
jgi:hypothetical protein